LRRPLRRRRALATMEDPLRDPPDFRHRNGLGNGKEHASGSGALPVHGAHKPLIERRTLLRNGAPVTTVLLVVLAVCGLAWYMIQYVSFVARMPGGSSVPGGVEPGEF